MRHPLLRIENLLLLWPLVMVGLLFNYLAPDGSDDYPGQAVFFIIANSIFDWLWMLLPGYLIHYFLRTIRRGSKRIAITHVLLSILTSIAATDTSTSIVPGWHTTIYAPLSGMFNSAVIDVFITLLFWFVQIAYIIYGIAVIRRWRRNTTP